MELSPIPGIRGVGSSTAARLQREVDPTFALDRSGRMEDDAYNARGQEEERGLEEGGSEPGDETEESAEMPSALRDADTKVNFFA